MSLQGHTSAHVVHMYALGDGETRMRLKGLAQAKIIKKSVILFWLLNMSDHMM